MRLRQAAIAFVLASGAWSGASASECRVAVSLDKSWTHSSGIGLSFEANGYWKATSSLYTPTSLFVAFDYVAIWLDGSGSEHTDVSTLSDEFVIESSNKAGERAGSGFKEIMRTTLLQRGAVSIADVQIRAMRCSVS